MRPLLTLGIALVLLGPSAVPANETAVNALVEAFSDDEAVRAETDRLLGKGFAAGAVQSMSLRGMCGVVGCSSTYLVGQTFKASGSSALKVSVLAEVTMRMGRVDGVRLVSLAPVKAASAEPQSPSPE